MFLFPLKNFALKGLSSYQYRNHQSSTPLQSSTYPIFPSYPTCNVILFSQQITYNLEENFYLPPNHQAMGYVEPCSGKLAPWVVTSFHQQFFSTIYGTMIRFSQRDKNGKKTLMVFHHVYFETSDIKANHLIFKTNIHPGFFLPLLDLYQIEMAFKKNNTANKINTELNR